MRRREILGVAGLGLASATMFAKQAIAQHPHHHDKLPRRMPQGMRGLRHDLQRDVPPLLSARSRTVMPNIIATAILTIDCQEFCRLSASELMSRESPLISIACLACADACKSVRGRVFQGTTTRR